MPDGVFAVNTLPDCERHHQEMFIFQFVFENFFISELISSNRVFMGRKSKMPAIEKIQAESNLQKISFIYFDVDTEWLLRVIHFNEKKHRNEMCFKKTLLMEQKLYHFDDTL